jgi:hypothetical protein
VRDLPQSITFGLSALLLGILLTIAASVRRRRQDDS